MKGRFYSDKEAWTEGAVKRRTCAQKVRREEGVNGRCAQKVWMERVNIRCERKVWTESVEGMCEHKVWTEGENRRCARRCERNTEE